MVWLPDGMAAPKPNRSSSRPKPKSKPAPRPSSRSAPSRSYSPPSSAPSMPYSSGPVQSVTPPKPRPPDIKSYLAGDQTYQQSVRGSSRTLKDFLSELNRRRGESKTTFGQTKGAMETDRVRQLEQMRDEFASRGLIHSGLYGAEQGRFQDEFAKQMQALEQQQTSFLADLLSQDKNFRREQQLALELARQEALSRRAERYQLGL